MGTAKNIGMLAKRKVDRLVESRLEKDPERVIQEDIRQQRQQVNQARRALLDMVAQRERYAIDREQAQREVERAEEYATLALQEGNRDLAKAAIAKGFPFERRVEDLDRLIAQQDERIATTADMVQRAAESHQARRDQARADASQYRANKAIVEVGERMAELPGGDDAGMMVDRATEQMRETEARARALSSGQVDQLPIGAGDGSSDPFAQIEAQLGPGGLAGEKRITELEARLQSENQLPEGKPAEAAGPEAEATETEEPATDGPEAADAADPEAAEPPAAPEEAATEETAERRGEPASTRRVKVEPEAPKPKKQAPSPPEPKRDSGGHGL